MEGEPSLKSIYRKRTHHNVVASRLLEHVGDQFCGDRRPTLVLLVLARIGEEGDDGGNPLCAGDLTGMDHDAKLHERCVYLATTSVDDINVILADGLCDAHVGFTDAGFRDCGSRDGNAETVGEVRRLCENRRLSLFSTVSRLFLPVPDDWSLLEACVRPGRTRKTPNETALPVKSLIPLPANIASV